MTNTNIGRAIPAIAGNSGRATFTDGNTEQLGTGIEYSSDAGRGAIPPPPEANVHTQLAGP